VLSVVCLCACAGLASLPVVVLLDIQREDPAKPQLHAICGIDSALGNCRKAPLFDSPRRSREVTRRGKAPVRHADNEISTGQIPRWVTIMSGVRAEAFETVALAAATAPRSPSNGKSADG
jgi:hypothetical protein